MKSKLLILIVLLFFIIITTISVDCVSKDNLDDKNIDIKINDVNIVFDEINLKKDYDEYAIINLKITNTSLEDIELANINYYVYQDDKQLETFIKMEDNKYIGFLGKLKSGESKLLRIYVALDNDKSVIQLKLEDLSTPEGERYENIINI